MINKINHVPHPRNVLFEKFSKETAIYEFICQKLDECEITNMPVYYQQTFFSDKKTGKLLFCIENAVSDDYAFIIHYAALEQMYNEIGAPIVGNIKTIRMVVESEISAKFGMELYFSTTGGYNPERIEELIERRRTHGY